jgi:PAS domain S-box-containing protein
MLAENEERLRRITDNMRDMICQVDTEGIIRYASPSFMTVLGYPPERLVGRSVFGKVHPEDLETARQRLKDGLAAALTQPFEHRAQHADGHYLWLEAVGSVMVGGDGVPAGVIIASRDISKRKRAEDTLREQTELLQMVFDYIPVMVVFFDQNGAIQMVNREYERTLGWSSEEVKNHPDILTEFYPDALYREAARNYIITAGSGWLEFKMRVRDGHSIETLWANVRLSDGRSMGIGQNITERKMMEQRQFETAVEKERADILQKFLSDASHDLRTPLTIIKTSIYLLRRLNTADKRDRHLDILTEQSDHLQRLLDDFLSMARLNKAGSGEFNFVPLDVNQVTDEVLTAHQALAAQKRQRVEFTRSVELPPLLADNEHLKRALSHLVANAVNYTPEGGNIGVETLQQDDWVVLRVRDTGMGINAIDLPRIFDPFYRADKARNPDTGGMGLGLAIVQRIVMAHGGRVEAESVVGEGSVFSVWLPLAQEVVSVGK